MPQHLLNLSLTLQKNKKCLKIRLSELINQAAFAFVKKVLNYAFPHSDCSKVDAWINKCVSFFFSAKEEKLLALFGKRKELFSKSGSPPPHLLCG